MTPDDLLTFRSIEELKYHFLRTLDLKDWNGFAEMFESDATAEYGEGLRFADAAEHRILIEGGAVYRDYYRRGADGQWQSATPATSASTSRRCRSTTGPAGSAPPAVRVRG